MQSKRIVASDILFLRTCMLYDPQLLEMKLIKRIKQNITETSCEVGLELGVWDSIYHQVTCKEGC